VIASEATGHCFGDEGSRENPGGRPRAAAFLSFSLRDLILWADNREVGEVRLPPVPIRGVWK
jgi:hypothetical protein